MNECIFCRIIKREIPCSKVYEDDRFLCFLDIMPINKGHILVIPKEHYETVLDMPDNLLKDIFVLAKKISKAVMDGTGADGFNIGINSYEAAGQVVMHMHLHIIPRFKDDGLKSWANKQYSEGEEAEMAEKIKSKL